MLTIPAPATKVAARNAVPATKAATAAASKALKKEKAPEIKGLF